MTFIRKTLLVMVLAVTFAKPGAAAEKAPETPQATHCRSVEIEVMYIPDRTCQNLPPNEYPGYVCSCEDTKRGSRTYAKVKWGRTWMQEQQENADYNSRYYGH
jgi:hypothetical protein